MSYRAYTGHAEVDIDDIRAFAICERCGSLWNHDQLSWQYDYRGPSPQNTRKLVCPTCLDAPNPTSKSIVLPPDPVPVLNARPPSAGDILSVRVTEDGKKRITEDDISRTTEESS